MASVTLAVVGFLAVGLPVGIGAAWSSRRMRAKRSAVAASLPSYLEGVAEPDEAVRFHAAVHDVVMTITEAWNAGGSRGVRRVAVEETVDRQGLVDRAVEVERSGEVLQARLAGLESLADVSEPLLDRLLSCWSYHREDHHVTAPSAVMIPVGQAQRIPDGQLQEVYAHTDHGFERNDRAVGELEARLGELRARRKRLVLERPRLDGFEVDLDRLPADQRSLAERLVRHTIDRSEEELSDARVRSVVNQWLRGAALDGMVERALVEFDLALGACESALRKTREGPGRLDAQTRSTTHPGPEGLQDLREARIALRDALARIRGVFALLWEARAMARRLREWATDSSVVESDRAYVLEARALYQQVFPGSAIALRDPPRLAGDLAVGAAAGTGAGLLVALGLLGLL